MTETSSDPDAGALSRAARRFTAALAEQAMLAATARLEARLEGLAEVPVLQFDAALAAAWPDGAPPPRSEVIWALGASACPALSLCAFDEAGRVLLRRTYGAKSAEPGHV